MGVTTATIAAGVSVGATAVALWRRNRIRAEAADLQTHDPAVTQRDDLTHLLRVQQECTVTVPPALHARTVDYGPLVHTVWATTPASARTEHCEVWRGALSWPGGAAQPPRLPAIEHYVDLDGPGRGRGVVGAHYLRTPLQVADFMAAHGLEPTRQPWGTPPLRVDVEAVRGTLYHSKETGALSSSRAAVAAHVATAVIAGTIALAAVVAECT
jgi:hypothetical protein